MTKEFVSQWLKICGWVVFVFGLIFASSGFPGFDAPGRFFVDFLKWPIDGLPGAPSEEARWMNAIGGGLTCGFGMIFVFLISPLIAKGEPLARRGGLIALIVWYIVDSSGSIASGVASNAIFNLGFFIPLAYPLWRVKL